ncbi:MAG: hypothetical protein L0228_21405 [Planctomycetes bacterium]|nr:hypothetical protein [Planctomycetota bacterium]
MLIFSLGVCMMHHAWHLRFANWRGAIAVGAAICLIALSMWFFDSEKELFRINDELKQFKEELLKQKGFKQ